LDMENDTSILNRFSGHLVRINEELERGLGSRISLIQQIGDHILTAEGKRLRPLLFVLTGRLCGYRGEDLYRLSAVFEYIHTASLLHDDVLDRADVRRKKPSANHLWGDRAAVLEGDFLYSKSFSIAIICRDRRVLEILTDTTARMAEGQILELIHTHDWDTSKAVYLEIVAAKTAALLSAACSCGAVMAESADHVTENLANFGFNMGIAYQMMDDYLDYTTCQEQLGKPVGKDLREGKITLPLIYTLSELDLKEKGELQKPFRNGSAGDADYRRLMRLVRHNGALERVRAEAEIYAAKAAQCLGSFPDSPAKQDVLELNRYIVSRTF